MGMEFAVTTALQNRDYSVSFYLSFTLAQPIIRSMGETEIESQVEQKPRQFTDDEIRAMYPGAAISPNRGNKLTVQENFDRVLRNAAAMAEFRRQQNRERIFARRSEQGE